MKLRSLALLALLSLAPLVSPLTAKDKKEAAAVEDTDEKRNTTIVEVTATVQQAHDAALAALAKIGCNIKKDAADAIEAKRPNKVGVAVGSGGEKLFVSIKELADGKAQITVRTKKTMMGIVGQKLWNEEVAADIQAALQ